MNEHTRDPLMSLRHVNVGRLSSSTRGRVGGMFRFAVGLLSAMMLVTSVLGASNCKLQDTSGYCQRDCEKTCPRQGADSCVAINDPEFGCASSSCAPCALPHAVSVCSNDGRCVIGGCETGYVDCDDVEENGCETDHTSSLEHCGDCSTSCLTREQHADFKCNNGLCVVVECRDGYQNCNQLNVDGCEMGPETPCDPSAAPASSANCK